MHSVIIVESPSKAQTIKQYLSDEYSVYATKGHICDLLPKSGALNPRDCENDFDIKWEMNKGIEIYLDKICSAIKKKNIQNVILATDLDREGEAISWHLLRYLKEEKILQDHVNIQRIRFNSITKESICEALEKYENQLNENLVHAYLARRILDYVVGFYLSPLAWRKIPGVKSIGRVQSPALRLICEKEQEIRLFQSQKYWVIDGTVYTDKQEPLLARLTQYKKKKLDTYDINNEKYLDEIQRDIESSLFSYKETVVKKRKQAPNAPYTTASLQRDCLNKASIPVYQTMLTAQSLYEGISIGKETVGLITYPRTDNVFMIDSFIQKIRKYINKEYSDEYLPDKPYVYKNKSKNAQESHECIRVTSLKHTPHSISKYLSKRENVIYKMIWNRTLSSQMSKAILKSTSYYFISENDSISFVRSDSNIEFDGFKILYEPNESLDQHLDRSFFKFRKKKIEHKALEKETKPPARYTEASLIEEMEKIDIGRPSTYSLILQTIKKRGYITVSNKSLIPEKKGIVLVSFMKKFFKQYIEYDFTALMEEKLDLIASQKKSWKDIIQSFWINLEQEIKKVEKVPLHTVIDTISVPALEILLAPYEKNQSDLFSCPQCRIGTLVIKFSRLNMFIACNKYPECSYIHQENKIQNFEKSEKIGSYTIRIGPYGWYVSNDKKQNRSIPYKFFKDSRPHLSQEDIDLLYKFPRNLGKEDDIEISVIYGKHGPCLKKNRSYFKINSIEKALSINIDEALAFLKEKNKIKGKNK